MKSIIITITAIIFTSYNVKAEPLSNEKKLEFINHYRKIVDLQKEFPNDMEVRAIFVDLNGDGEQEVLATSKGSAYEDGCDWTIFQMVNNKWTIINEFDSKTKKVTSGAAVYARPGEIFQVIKNDGTIDFLILSENFDKQAPDGLGSLVKTRFAIERQGYLLQEEVINLERYMAYSGSDFSGLVNKIEALEVESFTK